MANAGPALAGFGALHGQERGVSDTAASAWLYRDWVVQALNEDMPYDCFVKRQLATDYLPECGPKDLPALGFLGLSPTYFKELKLPPEIIKTTIADEWEEHIDALGRTFLGLTLACARCHDTSSIPSLPRIIMRSQESSRA